MQIKSYTLPTKFICLLAIFLSFGNANGQGLPPLDSLKKWDATAVSPFAKADFLNKMAFIYCSSESSQDSALHYGYLALYNSLLINDTKLIFRALMTIGITSFQKEDYKTCLGMGYAVVPLAEKINTPNARAKAYNLLGESQYVLKDDHAKKTLILAAETLKGMNEPGLSIGTYLYLGRITANWERNHQVALHYFRNAANIIEQNPDRAGESGITIYNSMAQSYDILQMPDSARIFFEKSYQFALKTNSLEKKALALSGLGKALASLRRFDEAKDALHKSISLFEQEKEPPSAPIQNLAYCLTVEGKSAEAIDLLNKNIAAGVLDSTQLDAWQYTMLLISDAFKVNNDYKNAFKYLRIAEDLEDSIFKNDQNNMLAKLAADHSLEKKQLELEDSQKETDFQYKKSILFSILAIISSILVLVTVVAYRNRQRDNKLLASQKSKLEQLNTLKDRLFSVISHDLRQPLNSLHSTLMLNKTFQLPEKVNEQLNRTANLLENVLQWSLVQLRGIKPIIEPVHAIDIVNDCLFVLKPNADQKNIAILNELPEDFVALGDKNMVAFIFRNLCSNAVKFAPIGGSLRIWATEENDMAVFRVEDNGPGVAPEFRDKLFDLQSGFSQTGSSGEKGTGLGLNLCRDFAQACGGKLYLGEKNTTGAMFVLELPLD